MSTLAGLLTQLSFIRNNIMLNIKTLVLATMVAISSASVQAAPRDITTLNEVWMEVESLRVIFATPVTPPDPSMLSGIPAVDRLFTAVWMTCQSTSLYVVAKGISDGELKAEDAGKRAAVSFEACLDIHTEMLQEWREYVINNDRQNNSSI
jgi:hypothetical protein